MNTWSGAAAVTPAASLQLQMQTGVQVIGEHALNHMVETPFLPVLVLGGGWEGLVLGLPGIELAAVEVSEGRPGYSRERGVPCT